MQLSFIVEDRDLEGNKINDLFSRVKQVLQNVGASAESVVCMDKRIATGMDINEPVVDKVIETITQYAIKKDILLSVEVESCGAISSKEPY